MGFESVTALVLIGSSAVMALIADSLKRDDSNRVALLLHTFLNTVAIIYLVLGFAASLDLIEASSGLTAAALVGGLGIMQWTLTIIALFLMLHLVMEVVNSIKQQTSLKGAAR